MSASPPIESTPPPSTRRPGLSWWQATALGVAVAVAANLLLLGLGHLVGASMTHPDPSGTTVDVTAPHVLLLSALPLVIGLTAAAALSLLWTGFLRTAQIIGTAVALLTVASPLLLDTDVATRVVLALMHVALAPVVWLSIAAMRRRALS